MPRSFEHSIQQSEVGIIAPYNKQVLYNTANVVCVPVCSCTCCSCVQLALCKCLLYMYTKFFLPWNSSTDSTFTFESSLDLCLAKRGSMLPSAEPRSCSSWWGIPTSWHRSVHHSLTHLCMYLLCACGGWFLLT